MANLQPEQPDDKDLDVFNANDTADDDDTAPTVRSTDIPHDVREADAEQSVNTPDLNLGGSTGQSEDPSGIFTHSDDFDLGEDEVQASELAPTLNLDEKEGDEEDGKGGSEDPESGGDPPLESVDQPDLTFGAPDSEPPLASNDLPDVTYGSSDEEPDLESTELPDIAFDPPYVEAENDVVESVEGSDGSEAVVFEGDDSAVILDDAGADSDEMEVGPLPDFPGPDDDDDNQSSGTSGHYTYDVAANPLFADHDFTLVYQDPDDEDDDDMGDGT